MEKGGKWGTYWNFRGAGKKEKKRDLEEKRREKSRKGGRLEARLPRYVSGYF